MESCSQSPLLQIPSNSRDKHHNQELTQARPSRNIFRRRHPDRSDRQHQTQNTVDQEDIRPLDNLHAPSNGEKIGGIRQFSLQLLRQTAEPKVQRVFARVVEEVHEIVLRYSWRLQRAWRVVIAFLDVDLLYRWQRRYLDDAHALALRRRHELELGDSAWNTENDWCKRTSTSSTETGVRKVSLDRQPLLNLK